MKKLKKVFAVLLSVAMILGMSSTVFAAQSDTDEATLTIKGLQEGVTVNLYQIASGKYGENGSSGFVKYVWNENLTEADIDGIIAGKADAINGVAQKIGTVGTLKNTATVGENGTYTYQVTTGAGAYIAVMTGGTDVIYNPVLLTATYGVEGTPGLAGGTINVASDKYFGTAAVAKSTPVTFDKSITGATEDTATDNKKIATGSVGQVLTYTLNATVPSYPSNATNKTFFMSDTMTSGLTFDYSSLNVTIAGQTVTKDGNEFKLGNKVIATAAPTPTATNPTGFNLSFTYDNLISDPETGATYTPVVSYNAVINAEAVVGVNGNPNDAYLYYAKEPNNGSTWDTPNDKPQKGNGIDVKDDKEIVYTYQLAFKKTGTDADAEKLAGAKFGVYSDQGCTKLIDVVTTNDEGIAVSSKVGAGTYYVKEIEAPEGYSLNDTVYEINATWSTATEKTSTTVITREYTDDPDQASSTEQVGWLKDDVFYNLANKPEGDNVVAAYLKSEIRTTDGTTVTKDNPGAGTVQNLKDLTEDKNVDAIPNTKLGELPSTGGIGTIIFTVGGCLIMVVAAALYFANRRRSANSESK